LHALDTPPAFILSQNQTLNKFLTRVHLEKFAMQTLSKF
jgi:hypothetical protein